MTRIAALLLAGFAFATPAAASDLAGKLCPVLAEAARETDQATIQMIVVFGMVDGVEDPEELGEFPPHADEIATATCPDDRAAVLAASRYASLEALMR